MKKIALFLSFAVLFTTTCIGKAEDEKTKVELDLRGDWSDEREYVNRYFGVSVSIPEKWYLKKGIDEVVNEEAVKLFGGKEENHRKSLRSAIEKTYTVFRTAQYDPGTPRNSNPTVSLQIENLKHVPGIKTGADYLLAMEGTLRNSNMNVSYKEDPVTIEMGGIEFWTREAIMPYGVHQIRLRSYATVKDGYILLFGLTLSAEEDEKSVLELLKTIRKIEDNKSIEGQPIQPPRD